MYISTHRLTHRIDDRDRTAEVGMRVTAICGTTLTIHNLDPAHDGPYCSTCHRIQMHEARYRMHDLEVRISGLEQQRDQAVHITEQAVAKMNAIQEERDKALDDLAYLAVRVTDVAEDYLCIKDQA